MNIFKRKRAETTSTLPIDDVLLKSLLYGEEIDREKAVNIPAVAKCVNLISETVSMILIKLYKKETMVTKSSARMGLPCEQGERGGRKVKNR